jgi:hypothetical protein
MPSSPDIVTMPLKGLKPNGLNQTIFSTSLADTRDLQRSIEEVGLKNPILVTVNGVIVDGERRYRAMQALGFTEIPAILVPAPTEDELLATILDTCTAARRLSLVEQVAVYGATLERLKRANGVKHGGNRLGGPEQESRKGFLVPPSEQESRKGFLVPPEANLKPATLKNIQAEAAKRAQFSSVKQAIKAVAVVERGSKEDLQAIQAGKVTITAAYNRLAKRAKGPSGAPSGGSETPKVPTGEPDLLEGPPSIPSVTLEQAQERLFQEVKDLARSGGYEAVKGWLTPLLRTWLEVAKEIEGED